jgi:hypothetical protein
METPRTPIRKATDVAAIALFLGGLALPHVANLFGWDPPKPGAENRLLASFPELQPKRGVLTAFPARFESYFGDNFGFRPSLVRWHALATVKGLGVSSSRQVALGQESWLFLNGEQSLEDYRATEPFSPDELDRWQQVLQARQRWLAERGVKYVLVVAPNKQTIYPEYLPPAINRAGPASRLDQLLARLRACTDLAVVDLRESLLRAKAREKLYFQTDTHWNDRGAYWGYHQLVNTLASWFADLRPRPRSAFKDQEFGGFSGDLARMIGLSEILHEDDVTLVPRQPRRARPATAEGYGETHRQLPPDQLSFAMACPDPRLPRAVVFRDSFGLALVPHLAEHFSRSVYFFQPTLDTDQYLLDTGAVERERPDVVIQEIVERRLMMPIPTNPGLLPTNPYPLPGQPARAEQPADQLSAAPSQTSLTDFRR